MRADAGASTDTGAAGAGADVVVERTLVQGTRKPVISVNYKVI